MSPIGVAADPGVAVVEQGVGVVRDERAVGGELRLGLALLEEGDGLGQDLGVVEEIGADLVAEGLPLAFGHGGDVEGRGGGRQREQKGEGGGEAHRTGSGRGRGSKPRRAGIWKAGHAGLSGSRARGKSGWAGREA
jgi:hypothetical protein